MEKNEIYENVKVKEKSINGNCTLVATLSQQLLDRMV